MSSCFLLTSIACIFQAGYRFSHVKWLCYFLRSCSSYGVDSVMYAIVNYLRSETGGLGLHLDSTATRHIFADVPLWLLCPMHQG